MTEFVAGHFDVLLATTIVESGLDIPNANTIFIDDAERYGLAELHQLRGRVGRYNRLAYCYLLVDPRKHVTPEAARRLRAIEEFSHMGAGIHDRHARPRIPRRRERPRASAERSYRRRRLRTVLRTAGGLRPKPPITSPQIAGGRQYRSAG